MNSTQNIFLLKKLPDGRALAVGISWHSVMDDIDVIAEVLSKECYTGEVVIDDTCSRGLNDRFYKIPFMQGHFDLERAVYINDPKIELRQNNWLKRHVDIMNHSILSQYEKEIILNSNSVNY